MSNSNQAMIQLYIDAAREALTGARYHDREAVETLVQRLWSKPSLQVQRVILFGSKARHDDTSESDIDILVIVADERWPVKDHILTIGSRLSLEHDVLLNLIVVSWARWTWMEQIRHPLCRAIVAEGIDLTPEMAPASVIGPSWWARRPARPAHSGKRSPS